MSFFKPWIPAFAGMTALLYIVSTHAADAPPPVHFLSAEELAPHEKTIARVEAYLSGLTTVIADFTQIAPDGSLTTGKFFLERPGKMRWQYNPPTPVLMVANGKELVYYDYELEQLSHIPLDSTLIGFLAQERVTFDKTVGITELQEEAGVIRVSLAQKERPTDGGLMLELSDKPLLIRNMVVTDATNQITSVSLNNAKFGTALDKNLFDFRDPRKPRRQR